MFSTMAMLHMTAALDVVEGRNEAQPKEGGATGRAAADAEHSPYLQPMKPQAHAWLRLNNSNPWFFLCICANYTSSLRTCL